MYVEIRFHDNDFITSLSNATHRLWKTIKYDNLNRSKELTIDDVFKELHKTNSLKNVLKAIWVLEHSIMNIELETLVLCDVNLNSKNRIKDYKEMVLWKNRNYFDYLDIEIIFHDNIDFAAIKHDHEMIILNTETGEIRQIMV